MMDNNRNPIIFKEAANKCELEDAFKLRYLAYKKMGFISLNGNTNHLEVEPYDYYSKHGIAYRIEGKRKEAIGTIRIITKEINKDIEKQIDQIVSDFKEDCKPSKHNRDPFPALKTFGIKDFIDGIEKYNRRICEIGRLVVHPDYWGNGIDLHRGLHEFATAVVYGKFALNDENNTYMQDWILLCNPKHEPAYKRLGFKRIENTRDKLIKEFNAPAMAMHGTFESSMKNAFYRSKDRIVKLYKKGFFCKCKTSDNSCTKCFF